MFTANMSGNSVVLGIRLGQGQWPEILIRAFRIPLFMTGVMVGALLIELSVRRGFRRIFSVIFFIEALLIGFFCLSGRAVYAAGALALDSPYFYAIAALPPVAMGLQTAALHRDWKSVDPDDVRNRDDHERLQGIHKLSFLV